MAGRGSTTFQKRQKEQQRKERQQEKFAKRMERKKQNEENPPAEIEAPLDQTAEHEQSREVW